MGDEPTRTWWWRVAEYLGLVADQLKPKIGTRQWWLTMLLIGVIGFCFGLLSNRFL